MQTYSNHQQELANQLDLWCRGGDLNSRTTKDRILSPTPLAKLGYPCLSFPNEYFLFSLSVEQLLQHGLGVLQGLLPAFGVAFDLRANMNAVVPAGDDQFLQEGLLLIETEEELPVIVHALVHAVQ